MFYTLLTCSAVELPHRRAAGHHLSMMAINVDVSNIGPVELLEFILCRTTPPTNIIPPAQGVLSVPRSLRPSGILLPLARNMPESKLAVDCCSDDQFLESLCKDMAKMEAQIACPYILDSGDCPARHDKALGMPCSNLWLVKR